MGERIKEIYDALGESPPERMSSGIAVWTTIRSADSGKITCVNPATNDNRPLQLADDGYPDEIAGEPIYTNSGGTNPAAKEIPIRIIVPAVGGFREAWIQKSVEKPSDLEEDVLPGVEREEPIEWEGTGQNTDEEGIKKRRDVFGDDRESKNDLIDGSL